jgi:signal transduction histidine kinase/ActR/RegA family two-component response regulator
MYGAIALTAGLYSSLDIIYPVGGMPEGVYVATGRLSYLVGTCQGVLWLLFAYSDRDGSLRAVPKLVWWVVSASVAGALLFIPSPWLLTGEVPPVHIAWAGVTYHYPLASAAGGGFGLVLLLLPAAAVLRLAQRYRKGEKFLGRQVGLFAVTLLFAVEEVLVGNRVLNFVSLLDLGFLLLLVPLSWQVIERVGDDAQKLGDLSEHLKQRTEQLEAANRQLRDEMEERERAGEALRESQVKLEAALASTTDAVFISDAQGRFVDFNDAFATFHRFRVREECPPTLDKWYDVVDLFLPDGSLSPLEMWPVLRALRGEKVANAEYTLRRRDTGETWAGSYSFGPVCGKDGAILGSVVVGRDITEQKQAEQHLRHSQKLESVGVLAGGIAHDFNNLLTTILGNASMLRMQTTADAGERVAAIMESGERAAGLTRQLLAYAGKAQFEITDFDVSRLVRSTTDLIRMSVPKSTDVEIDVPRDLPLVRGDASQIQQVVMNLVMNAAEAIAGGTGGRVSVCAGVRDLDSASAARLDAGMVAGGYVSITVRDNGCGMDEPTKAKIFDPFFTTKFTGRGLGLAAVHGILRSHQGTIKVESRPGQGSTFTVYLPSSHARPAASAGEAARRTAGRTATILVVDDEEPIRVLAKAALEGFGHRVLLAADGQQALDVLGGKMGVDLAVLDLIMPGLAGVEAFSEMRRRWPRLPILVVTGFSRYEAYELGIPRSQPFLEKPYTIQMLAAAVEKVLQVPAGRSEAEGLAQANGL